MSQVRHPEIGSNFNLSWSKTEKWLYLRNEASNQKTDEILPPLEPQWCSCRTLRCKKKNWFPHLNRTSSKSGGLLDGYGQIYQCPKATSPKVGVKDVAFFWLSYSSRSGEIAQTSYQEPLQGFQMYQQQKWRTCGQIWTDEKSPSPKVGVKDVAFFWLS